MNYVYRYEIAAVIITFAVMISLFRKKVISTKAANAFSSINFLVFVSSSIDIAAIIFLKNPPAYPVWLHYTINTLYQISFHCIAITFYYCIFYLSENNQRPSLFQHVAIILPYAGTLFLDFSNIFTKWVFYIDSQGYYHQGKLIWYMYVQGFFYLIMGLLRVFKRRNKFSLNNKIVIFIYTMASLGAVLVQWIFPQLMITGFVLAISVLLGFLCLENPQDYIDKEMGVYNRIAFNTIIPSMIDSDKKIRFLGIKFEEMKYLNETIGIENRISLMKSVSSFLQEVTIKKNIFRLSRSKIVLILNNDEKIMQEQIEKIREKFSQPLKAGDVSLSLSVFLDIVFCPEDAQTVEDALDLIENSFNSIVTAKKLEITRSNKNVLGRRKREHQILMILEKAIKNEDFEVVYQPIYDVKQNKYTTAEALIRLKNTELGFIKPEEFIPLAEQNGMILKIGNFVFKSVCKFLKETQIWEKGIEYIHINLSVIQCMQERLYEQLFAIVDFYGIPYKYINLEVTETSANASQDILKNNMKVMLENQMRFSLDDYGTGFSNTASLIEYPFNMIKLDKSLIWDAIKDEKARVILKRTINMIKELGMLVIAEGVETKNQVDMVKSLGCDYIQGYFYSYPLTGKDFCIFMQ